MKKIEITKVGASLAEFAKNVGDGVIVVTQDGRPIAALLGIGDMDWNTLELRSIPLFATLLRAIEAQQKSGKGLFSEDLRWMVGVPPCNWEDDVRFAPYLEDEQDEAETPAEELAKAS